MPVQTTIKFVNNENNVQYKKAVLAWLKSDFDKQGKPQNHFWNNRSTIETAFDNNNAMVAFNEQKDVVGYMIWNMLADGSRSEIDIIEVKKDYRGQGIFKRMLAEFCDMYAEVLILSANVLQQSEAVFIKDGWQAVYGVNNMKKYIKLLKPILDSHNELMDGRVIAICAEDCYKVKFNPEMYKKSMKYFPIKLSDAGKLIEPIVTPFKYEGYIGVYVNKVLIAEGKAKHLFETGHDYDDINYLIISKIKILPENLKLFTEKGFFSENRQKLTEQQVDPPAHIDSKVSNNDENDENDMSRVKRQKLEVKHPVFQPAKQESQKPENADRLLSRTPSTPELNHP